MNKTFFIGVVENREEDPLQLGRVQVRVFGVHSESLEDVPTTSLPWAIPLMPATSASLSGIGHSVTQYVPGTMVFLFFQDGESKQQPIIMGSFHGIPQAKSLFGPNGVLETETIAIGGGSGVTQVGGVSQSSGTVSTQAAPAINNTSGVSSSAPTRGVDISRAIVRYSPNGNNIEIIQNTLLDYGIQNDNALIAILANVAKECSFKPVRESVVYSTISRIRAIFPSKTKNLTDEQLTPYINNEVKLANLVYSNSDGNGDEDSGDGYKYRGRGFIQLTKKNNYASIGSKIGVNLVNNPDLVLDPSYGAKVVAQYIVDRFGGANRLNFSSLESAIVAVTKAVNPGGFSGDYPKVKEASTYFKSRKTPSEIEEESIKEESKNPGNPETDLDKNATQSQIDSGNTSKKTTTSNLGFKDPKQKFPLTAMLKEQDTNRLSRRNTTGTLIETKLKNRRSSIKTIGGTFAEPLPSYNASYPFNHVFYTEAGHALEFDDTVGSERVQLFHKSGTFTEIDKFGNQVNKIVGDNFTITERNGYVYVDGTARVTIGSDVKLKIGGNLDVSVDGNITYDVGGSVVWKVGGAINSKGGAGISMRSDGNIDMDGSKIYMNSKTARNVDVSARSGRSVDYPIQSPPTFVGDASLKIEEQSEAVVNKYIDEQIAQGNITKKEVDDGNVAVAESTVVDNTPPENTATVLSTSCSMFENKTVIPDSTQLSPNYTLGMVSSKAAASNHRVIPQHGLLLPEIVCNLKKVVLNCVEPIKAKYPQMIVTSGFRQGSGSSQHERGMAIDMQFGTSNSEYFEIATWIKNNIPFDQLLLEYKTIESGRAWIHISFSDSLRRQIFTYMNHKNVGSGLRKLQ